MSRVHIYMSDWCGEGGIIKKIANTKRIAGNKEVQVACRERTCACRVSEMKTGGVTALGSLTTLFTWLMRCCIIRVNRYKHFFIRAALT